MLYSLLSLAEVIETFILPIAIVASLMIAFIGSKKLNIKDIELNIQKRQRFERIRWIFNEYIPSGNSPVMFQRGAVLKDRGTGKSKLQLKFINVSQKQIKSAYGIISFLDDAGDIVNGAAIQAEYLDINCGNNDTFGQKQLLELGDISANHVSITFSKVVFTDGTVWRAQADTKPQEPAKVTLLKSTLPPELQKEVSEDAICKPEVIASGIWRCTCGCLAVNGYACSNCHRTFEKAQADTSINALQRQVQKRIAEQEQKALEEEASKKEIKAYTSQLILSLLTLMISRGAVIPYSTLTMLVLLVVIYYIIGFVSVIATALLVRKSRSGKSMKKDPSIWRIIKVQGITALALCTLCIVSYFVDMGSSIMNMTTYYDKSTIIGDIVRKPIYAIPCIIYCLKVPYAKSRLSKHIRKIHAK